MEELDTRVCFLPLSYHKKDYIRVKKEITTPWEKLLFLVTMFFAYFQYFLFICFICNYQFDFFVFQKYV
jgi:hypothetical protein